MTLVAYILKYEYRKAATAIAAISATQCREAMETIAKIANLAVAGYRHHKRPTIFIFSGIFVWTRDCARYHPIILFNLGQFFSTWVLIWAG